MTISRALWLGQTEVTHGQWRAMMGTDLTAQTRRMLADDTRYAISGKPGEPGGAQTICHAV